MKHIPIVLLALALLSGCAGMKPKCADQDTIVSPVAAFLASPIALDCSNPEEIVKDLEGLMGSLNLCEAQAPKVEVSKMGGPLGSLICPPLVAWGTSALVNNSARLKKWGCKGTGVQAAFVQACQFIPL